MVNLLLVFRPLRPKGSDNVQLASIEQKHVVFYDDELTAVIVQGRGRNEAYVLVWPICEFLGVSWTGQRRQINQDPVLLAGAKGVKVTVTPGGRQEMSCLPLDYISGLLPG